MTAVNNAKRRQRTLNTKTEKAIFNYALVAGAAGVSVLALTQPSEGKIVYTPTHQMLGSPGTLNIDVNNDGISDFNVIDMKYSSTLGGSYGAVMLNGGTNSNNLVVGQQPQYASALITKARIGSSDTFTGGANGVGPLMELCTKSIQGKITDQGPWPYAKNKYLGLRFTVNGEVHYGWARFSLTRTECRIRGVLSGYAYETIPNKPILAGKQSGLLEAHELLIPSAPAPAALGLLARGADSLVAWRREDEVVKN
jgi:hypothetical protein